MCFLFIFGKNVEDAFGRLRYLALYVVGGLAATAAQAIVTVVAGTATDERVALLGASGAIAAVLGAHVMLYPGATHTDPGPRVPGRDPGFRVPGPWFLYQVVSGHMGLVSSSAHGGGTAFFAHLGGFVFGAPGRRRSCVPAQPDRDLDVVAFRLALALQHHLSGDRNPNLLAAAPQLERPTSGESERDVRQALRGLLRRDAFLVFELPHERPPGLRPPR
jgi:hypothetical protein